MTRNEFVAKYASKLLYRQLAEIMGINASNVTRRAHRQGISVAFKSTLEEAEKLYPIALAEWQKITPKPVEKKFEVPAEVARINKLWRVTKCL